MKSIRKYDSMIFYTWRSLFHSLTHSHCFIDPPAGSLTHSTTNLAMPTENIPGNFSDRAAATGAHTPLMSKSHSAAEVVGVAGPDAPAAAACESYKPSSVSHTWSRVG